MRDTLLKIGELAEELPVKEKKQIQKYIQPLLIEQSNYEDIIPIYSNKLEGRLEYLLKDYFEEIEGNTEYYKRGMKAVEIKKSFSKKHGDHLPEKANRFYFDVCNSYLDYLDKIYYTNNGFDPQMRYKKLSGYIPKSIKNDWMKSRHISLHNNGYSVGLRALARAINKITEQRIYEYLNQFLEFLNKPNHEASK